MTENLASGHDHHVPAAYLAAFVAFDEQQTKDLVRAAAVPTSMFVSRAEWGARPPRPGIAGLDPTFGGTIHYEAAAAQHDHGRCAAMVRGIQSFHMDSRGWLDIAYTSLGCIHGYVYEGRWLRKRTAAQGTNEGNATAYAHCLMIGVGEIPTEAALDGAAYVVKVYRRDGSGRNVNGHRDWHATACPGDPTYAALPTIRARADAPLPAPPTPPTPGPGPTYPEDSMTPYSVTVPIGNHRGYVDVPVDIDKVVSVVWFGGDPADGWDPAPVLDYSLEAPKVGVTRVQIPHSDIESGKVGGRLWAVA